MRTIGGGIVRYVDVTTLPCPEDTARLGHVVGAGVLEVHQNGRAIETFELRDSDTLLVADGAEVARDTELVDRDEWARRIRAGFDGTAHWSEPLVVSTDDVTGLVRRSFAATADPDPVLELRARDGTLASYPVPRGLTVALVDTGELVRCGELLASIARYRSDCEILAGGETVCAWLDGCRVSSGPAALVAPCDATVVEIGKPWVVLRSRDDRTIRLRRTRHLFVRVAVGDTVRAGDPLTLDERDHRALLHAWGPERLSEHLIDELELVSGRSVPRVYWALAVRAMLRGPGLRGFRELARAARRQNAVQLGVQRSL